MDKYVERNKTQIYDGNLRHVTSQSGLKKIYADGFLLDRVYVRNSC